MSVKSIIDQIASDAVIDEAYKWLCQRRKDYHYNDDVWHLRYHWDTFRPLIQVQLRSGRYRFSPVRLIRGTAKNGFSWLWSAADALVLKATALVLGDYLSPLISSKCHHLAGNGGAKGAVRAVQEHIREYTFVFRSDVQGYYEAIDHECLIDQLKQLIHDPMVLKLLHGYMKHLEDDGGILRPVNRGISLGCPLSPLMSALYLKSLDDAMEKTGLFYARFMDDWVVLSPSRWKLRKAISKANQVLEQLKVEKHPDKTCCPLRIINCECLIINESGARWANVIRLRRKSLQSWLNIFFKYRLLCCFIRFFFAEGVNYLAEGHKFHY
jgi:RNA-directed DNA polymerase